MKKIIEIIPSLSFGGAEKFVYYLCSYIDRINFDVTLILYYCSEENEYYKKLIEKGIKIITLNKRRGFSLKFFKKVYMVLKQLNPDIIHSHINVNLYLLPYYFFNKNVKGFHTMHSLANYESTIINRNVEKILYKSRKVTPIAISNAVKKSIVDLYKIDSNEIPCIYNGINTNKFKSKKEYSKSSIIRFVAVGRLEDVKNYDLMIDAFDKTAKIYNNIILNILGEGSLKNQLIEKVKLLNLTNKINFLGNVNNVEDYLINSDCFLMSSNFEGLPLSLLEAMSCGLPIIATKAGGIVDAVQDGLNGYLSEIKNIDQFSNNIIKMINNNHFEKFGKKSKEISKLFDIKNCVKSYEELFKQ